MPSREILLELFVLVAGAFDLKTRRIPNWLTLPGIALGIGLNWYSGELRDSLLGFALAFLVYFALFALRARGGGDVKLMAAVGAFAGWYDWFRIFIVTSILGGVLVLIALARSGELQKTLENVGKILSSLARFRAPHTDHPELDVGHPSARTMPHGAVIALGTLVYLVASSA